VKAAASSVANVYIKFEKNCRCKKCIGRWFDNLDSPRLTFNKSHVKAYFKGYWHSDSRSVRAVQIKSEGICASASAVLNGEILLGFRKKIKKSLAIFVNVYYL